MRLLSCLVAFATLTLLSGCLPETPYPERIVFPPITVNIPQITPQVLATGDRLYLRENHELPLVEITLMAEGGAVHDPAGRTGLSSLLAAALRHGGAGDFSPEALDLELDNRAMEVMVQADTYATSVRLSLRARDLDFALDVLFALLQHPAYAPERMELVRQQLLEGVRRRDDDPGSLAQRLLTEALYAGHPLGRSSSLKSLRAISRADLLKRHRQVFQPGKLWLAVSGDVTAQQLAPLLETRLSRWAQEQRPRAVDWTVPPLPDPPSGGVVTVQRPLPQTTILLGGRGLTKDSPDLQAVRVMNHILGGGGFTSHLMQEVRSQRGLAYSVYSYFQVGRRLPGLFIAGAETKTATTGEVVQLIRQQLERMATTPPTEEELALAKDSLINSFIFAFEGTHSVVEQQVRLDFYDYPPDYLQNYRQRVAAVTAADVQRVARAWLPLTDPLLVLVGNVDVIADQVEALGQPAAAGARR